MRRALFLSGLTLAALQALLGLTVFAFGVTTQVCVGKVRLDSQGNVVAQSESCTSDLSISLPLLGLGVAVIAGGGLAAAGILSARRRRLRGLGLVLAGALLGIPLLLGLYLAAIPFLVAVVGAAFALSERAAPSRPPASTP